MTTCSVCESVETKLNNEIEVDYCMVCGIFRLNFGDSRPKLYKQVEAQTQRWEKQLQWKQ